MLPPELMAAMNGMDQGRNALTGVLPSGTNAGGAPGQNTDDMQPLFAAAHSILMKLIHALQTARQEQDSNKVFKLTGQLQRIAIERKKRIAENQADQASGNPMMPGGAMRG